MIRRTKPLKRTPLKRSTKPLRRTAIVKKYRPQSQRLIVLPDGREICSDAEYKLRRGTMAVRQCNKCAICHRFSGELTFDHEAGRGMNASKRDDRLTHPDGRWRNAAVCLNCNTEKGSKPYQWVDGKYVPARRNK
jgi:hypothetical protein